MKIEVLKSNLTSALSVVATTVSAGTDLSSHYLFRENKEKLEVLSASARTFSLSSVIAKLSESEPGEVFTVEAWRIERWVSAVPEGVIKISSDGKGEVLLTSGRSKLKLRSLDHSKFPFWDNLVSGAKSVGVVPSISVSKAFDLVKNFVSTEDTTHPALCQVDVLGGVLRATDRKALTLIKLPALPDMNLRIPGRDLSLVSKFLHLKGSSDIEIKQAARIPEAGGGSCAFFVRQDGSYLGVTCPVLEFPKLEVNQDDPSDFSLSLDLSEFNAALSSLLAGAPKGHHTVTFSLHKESGLPCLSMPCEAGGDVEHPLSNSTVTNPEKFDTPFTIISSYLNSVFSSFSRASSDKTDRIEFGVTKKGRGGFISFKYTDGSSGDGNQYFSVILWRT